MRGRAANLDRKMEVMEGRLESGPLVRVYSIVDLHAMNEGSASWESCGRLVPAEAADKPGSGIYTWPWLLRRARGLREKRLAGEAFRAAAAHKSAQTDAGGAAE